MCLIEAKDHNAIEIFSRASWEVSVKAGELYVKFDNNEYALTKSGERKFTFGAQNESELVFVRGKDGKIDFLFTELYSAKRGHN